MDFPAVSADYIIDLYHRYLREPAAVDPSWEPYFDELWGRGHKIGGSSAIEVAAALLTDAYRQRGHLAANVNPLASSPPAQVPELDPASYGIDEFATDRAVSTSSLLGIESTTLRGLIGKLNEFYCRAIGFDCGHVDNTAARAWLYAAAENGVGAPDVDQRRTAAKGIIEANEFEHFFNRRFPRKKRFGAEGAEAIVPWFDAVLARCAGHGVRDVIIGGTARGRLNVMANIIKKPLTALLHEFKGGRIFPEDIKASSDVSYHFGHVTDRVFGGATVRVTYCHNPSHLEAIDGVALGRVRVRQDAYASPEEGWRSVLGLLVHTDAAFSGQGVACEVLQLSQLQSYRTGGTIHIVINNQIGFTTDSSSGRSSIYCTDFARVIGAPVLHVNADDIDAVVRTANIAADYRQRFHADIIVDLVSYRRVGHNEIDEPTFTQPMMYRTIAGHSAVSEIYTNRIIADGLISREEAETCARDYFGRLDAAHGALAGYRPNRVYALDAETSPQAALQDFRSARDVNCETGVPLDEIRTIGAALSVPPRDLAIHPKIERQLKERADAFSSGEGISWALGEALAFATLACEGRNVRFSGQDTPRGAFSQRHFILIDQETGAAINPFNRLQSSQGRCEIIGSPLSEYSVLGFEYGYSIDARNTFVVWEAQFGDFANVAQVIIDQFIASAEDKWLEASNITLMLPHGLEGQGPDHSSARIERFLQLCADENMTVSNCSTPANFFHLLRRQAGARLRKPLVVFTPKSLLRNRLAVSSLKEFGPGTEFRAVVGCGKSPASVRRVVLCSGKIYYDLLSQMTAQNTDGIALVRVEQLYPFPAGQLQAELMRFRDAEVVWCQEEPENMGPWSFVDRKIESILHNIGNTCSWPHCVSRPATASTAIGTSTEHAADQAQLVARATRIALAGNRAATICTH